MREGEERKGKGRRRREERGREIESNYCSE
jgi:hypothetical protein